MTRSGMVRLGPLALILAVAGPTARGSLIPYELADGVNEAPAGSPLPGPLIAEHLDDLAAPPLNANLDVSPDRFRAARPDDSTTSLGLETGIIPFLDPFSADGRPATLAEAMPPSPSLTFSWTSSAFDGQADAPSSPVEMSDDDSAIPTPTPPLALAFMLGVAAWTIRRRLRSRRSTMRRRRRPAPTTTATVTVTRTLRPRSTVVVTRMLEATAPSAFMMIPATFVEVSRTTGPPALPGWCSPALAAPVAVRCRRARRISA